MSKKMNAASKTPTEYPVRGNEFVGRVVSAKAPKTVTVLREMVVYVPKFERYKKVRSKIHAHNPDSIHAKEDDVVKVGETRKISKTKSFIVTEIVGKAKTHVTHEEMVEGAKIKEKNVKTEETA